MNKNWNLSGVFASQGEATLSMRETAKSCEHFKQAYKSRIGLLEIGEFTSCVRQYSELEKALCKIESYAFMLNSTNLLNPQITDWNQEIGQKLSDARFCLSFFAEEIEAKEDWDWNLLSGCLSRGEIAALKKIVRLKPHALASQDLRTLFKEQEDVHQYWFQLYDQMQVLQRFEIGSDSYSQAEIRNFLDSQETTDRHQAGRALSVSYAANNQIYATIFNAIIEKNLIAFNWRNYKYPAHAANVENDICAEDLKNLVNTVLANAAQISHRYYKIKARLFGVPKISYWDRNAVPDIFKGVQKVNYTIEEARDLILQEFRRFSAEFADIAAKFFETDKIDYLPYGGKTSLSYCMEMPVGVDPFICLNFTGCLQNVTTMAHELGHGVHEYLSKEQGELGRHKSVAQAEVASIFGEMLVFHGMLQKAKTPREKMSLLAQRIGDMILVSFRQISLHQFEEFAYERRKKGHVSAAELSEAFERFVAYPLGDAVDMTAVGVTWPSIPHFFLNAPFYVYSYCFSLCVANSLYEVYQSKSIPDFEKKYMDMLRNGGVENYREALAHFGIDAAAPEFWQNGLNLIKRYIDELEQLVQDYLPD